MKIHYFTSMVKLTLIEIDKSISMNERFNLENIKELSLGEEFYPFKWVPTNSSMIENSSERYYISPRPLILLNTPSIPDLGINFKASEKKISVKDILDSSIYKFSSSLLPFNEKDSYFIDEEDYESFSSRKGKVEDLKFRFIDSVLQDKLEFSSSIFPIGDFNQEQIDNIRKIRIDVIIEGESYSSKPEITEFYSKEEKHYRIEAKYFYLTADGPLPYEKGEEIEELNHPGNKIFIPSDPQKLQKIRSRIILERY